MTHIAIIGAVGMVGKLLANHIISTRRLGLQSNTRVVSKITLCDIRSSGVTPPPDGVEYLIGDAADPAVMERLAMGRPDVVFHVAATFMGQADSDFAIGYHINFDTIRCLAEAARLTPEWCPRVVHASSIGVYGPPFPDMIEDDTVPLPDSSYGAQKLMSETILADYSRLGFLDGVSLRLPTLSVRPGAATHGNSGFFSNIVRGPLAGESVVLPATEDVCHWITSPRSAVDQLLHAACLPSAQLVSKRAFVTPGCAVLVSDLIEATQRSADHPIRALIRTHPSPQYMPKNFPAKFAVAHARTLGFPCHESSANDLVATYLAHIKNK